MLVPDPAFAPAVTAARRLFGTDGVRGVAGVDLTETLARDLGAAAAVSAGPGARIVIGRDTRESGPSLENALVEGVVAAGGRALRAGVIPTPAVAVLTRLEGAERGCVISASHNPYRDNGIKFLGPDGRKLDDAAEAAIEAGLGSASAADGGNDAELAGARGAYADWLVETYGPAAPRLHVVLDCANGAAHAVAPAVFSAVGMVVRTIGTEPDGRNINAGVGSTHLAAVAEAVRGSGAAGGFAFDGDADRCLAVDADGRPINGDAIIAAVALAREVDRVVVTSMTNLGFHRLMGEHGIAVEVTDVGDRYVLERMLATGATLGGEQSGHVVDLRHHTTGDGIATALMLLAALDRLGITMAGVADLVPPFPQKLIAVPADRTALAGCDPLWQEVRTAEAKLGRDGRVVVRASGTEPVVRVMVEALDAAECERLCDHLAGVVAAEIGGT
jgi:phosphoglucosamine mutase